MEKAGIQRLVPGPKEGLAMTNGAQLTAAVVALATSDAWGLVVDAEIAAAMSWEALRGVTRALHPKVHALRPYPGAIRTARNLTTLLAGSGWADSVPGKVQDAYSLRCTPVVYGAVRDALTHVTRQISIELNSVTDNPVILLDEPDENKAFSAGLFHGEPLGFIADYLKLALIELGALAERRIYRMTTGTLSSKLPPLLAGGDTPSLGLMMPAVTAASLVSANRQLAYPNSADSIPTCEDQEDHVAMSTAASRRAAEVLANTRRVIAVELLAAARGMEWRRQQGSAPFGTGTEAGLAVVQSVLESGGVPSDNLARIEHEVLDGTLRRSVVKAVGSLSGAADV
jgi:histidine ammonia-lyase